MGFRLIINEDNRTVPVGIVHKYFKGFGGLNQTVFLEGGGERGRRMLFCESYSRKSGRSL